MGISFILAAARGDGTGWTRMRERRERESMDGPEDMRWQVGSWSWELGLGVGAPPVLAGRPRDRGSAGCDASLRGSCLLSLHASLTGLQHPATLGQQCVHIAGPL